MHRMRARLSTLTVAFCAALAFGLLGVVARADEGDYAFRLTVNETASTDAAFVRELRRADVEVDVYRVASAEKDATYDTYDYTWDVEAFAGLQGKFEAVSADRGSAASDWQELYDEAAKVVADAKGAVKPDLTVAVEDGAAVFEGESALPARGVYLVMAHGAGEEPGSTVAYSDRYAFTFPATMVAAPTKWADGSGDMAAAIYTDGSYADGTASAWHDEATINLKSEQRPLFGRLVIDKAVDNYELDEVTFVFRVRNVATDTVGLGEIYDEYAAITLDGSSPTGSTVLTHIPAQLRVQIEETGEGREGGYEGGRYKYVSTEWKTDNVILSDHDVEAGKGYATEAGFAEVLVNNTRGGNNPGGGHGVENHFDFVPDATGGNWPIDMRPSKPHTPATTE